MAEILNLSWVSHMEDQGVVLGTALGLKDLGYRFFIQTVGTKTVDCLRGNCYKAATADDFRCGLRSQRVLRRQVKSFHIGYLNFAF